MAENVMDHIVAELRQQVTTLYPSRGELRNIRVVGHTPKSDHFIYDLVADFANGAERMAVKVYRSGKTPQAARSQAMAEYNNLERVYTAFSENQLAGVPRPLGNFSGQGAVVSEKIPSAVWTVLRRGHRLITLPALPRFQQAPGFPGQYLQARRIHRAGGCTRCDME